MRMRANRRKIDLSLDEMVQAEMHVGARAVEIGPDPEERYATKEVLGMVESMFGRLPSHHAEVLWMSVVQELTGREVAQILNVSVATVKSRLYRPRTILSRSTQPMLGSRCRRANAVIRGATALAPQTAAGD